MSWFCSVRSHNADVLVNTLRSETDGCLGSVLLGLTTLMYWLTHCSLRLTVVLVLFYSSDNTDVLVNTLSAV